MLEKIFREVPPLPNHWPGQCFGCAPSNDHGLHLQFWLVGEECASKFQIPAEFSGFEGIAHGGIVASVLDEAGAWTIVTQLERLGMTQDTTIRYYRPVPVGRDLLVVARIIEHDATRVITTAEITGPRGTLLAAAKSNWALPNLVTMARATGIEEQVIGGMLERVLAPIRKFIQSVKR
jgi:acyl-coenzyme A thioesterase PaaI-like protein